MYIKVYAGNKPIFLCNEIDSELKELLHHPDTVFIDEISGPAIKSLLHEMKKEGFHAGVLCHENLEELKKAFSRHFLLVPAAGGLVQNEKGEFLMIFRRGKWDLPKGKLDPGETLEACAVREVEEETGVQHIELKQPLGSTWHIYDEFGKHILKETHWYSMKAPAGQTLVPQTEEDIQQLEWGTQEKLPVYLANTYPSVAEILRQLT